MSSSVMAGLLHSCRNHVKHRKGETHLTSSELRAYAMLALFMIGGLVSALLLIHST